MGITGLLPFIEKASRKCNIGDFPGCTVAIDTYCWLHKGAFACADKLVRGEHTDVYVHYCLKYVNMLLAKNVKPILVFDGRHLPAKALTEDKRRESRRAAKKRAAELLQLEKIEEAKSFMRRGVDVTHEMALNLIKECRKRNVDCIVAPYEADAQLAYLNIQNVADIVITEDSDLILFGCTKVLFKMDLTGSGTLVETAKLPLMMKCPIEKYSFNKFRQMCIMSGCDYLASLPSIGLAKARQFINTTQDPDISNALRKLPSFFNKSQIVVTDEYRENFLRAEATFKHQLVYNPFKRRMEPLTDPEKEGTDEKYCNNAGEYLKSDVAFQLAVGNLDPFSMTKMDDWSPDERRDNKTAFKSNGWNQVNIDPHPSIWSPDFLSKLKEIENRNKINDKPSMAMVINQLRPLPKKTVTLMAPPTLNMDNGLSIEQLSTMYRREPPLKKPSVVVEETQDFSQYIEVKSPPKSRNPFAMHPSDNDANRSLKDEEKDSGIVEDSQITHHKPPTLKKRFVADSDDIEIKSPKRLKNPVAEADSDLEIISIDSTEKENSPKSSPIKATYATSPILIAKQRKVKSASYTVLRKLSKFDRTSIDDGKPVESKFFAAAKEDEEQPIRLTDLLDDDSTSPSHATTIKNRILTQDIFSQSQISVDCHTEETIITLSEESQDFLPESLPEASPSLLSGVWMSKTQHSKLTTESPTFQRKPSCKRGGLSRKNSSSSLPSSQQSLLTMFGFQKRSSLKH